MREEWHPLHRRRWFKARPNWEAEHKATFIDHGNSIEIVGDIRHHFDTYPPSPWYQYVWGSANRWISDEVLSIPRRIKYFWQRGKRGWSDYDTYQLDSYLATVLSETLLHLAEHSHGWPGGPKWPTYEGWVAELKRHSEVLAKYVWHHDGHCDANNCFELEAAHDKEVANTFTWLGKWWGHLWD